ncbi:response regulator transcription factor [Catenovulum sp. SM1970]|uniref:response regulator transcription factor n=1 Tax=Marinifaba aquimaris TaxID=2741323 RepID=UPI001571D91A|nr:response regulator transcription factor [Marinifaba aquimaris]NTS77518.1 response regulator transcription factor [Marinifaba aquimaris]
MPQAAQQVLIVEDDQRLNQMIADMLVRELYQVSSVYDGPSAIEAICQQQPDIVLLDKMLPGCDGLEVLRQIYGQYDGIILMITAAQDDILEVSALNLGVHDYINKPVRPHSLLARMRALSRLSQQNQNQSRTDDIIEVQDLAVNLNRLSFTLAGEPIELTEAESEILLYFMRNPGVVLSRDMIISEIRKIEYDGLDRSIDMRVSALRKKLNDSAPPYKYIKTLRGKGYILLA